MINWRFYHITPAIFGILTLSNILPRVLSAGPEVSCGQPYTVQFKDTPFTRSMRIPLEEELSLPIDQYDPELRKCTWHIEGPCDTKNEEISCPGSATCEPPPWLKDSAIFTSPAGIKSVFDGTCSCTPGYDYDGSHCIRMKKLGEPCNDSAIVGDDPESRCSFGQNLYCIEGKMGSTCRCEEGFQFRKVDGQEKCVAAKYGEQCTPEFHCKPYQGLKCSQDGKCFCEVGKFFDHEKEFCRLAKLGETCGNGIVCEQDYESKLVCSNSTSTCSCKENYLLEQVPDSTTMECRLKAGESCSYDKLCTKYATCEGASYSHRKCTCPEGYTKMDGGTCLANHGSKCQSTSDCFGTNVACLNGICRCEDPLFQVYRSSKDECISLVGGQCSATGTSKTMCIEGANCSSGRCRCMDNYVTSWDLSCKKGYGSSCGKPGGGHPSSSDSGSNQEFECDPSTGLVCSKNKCECLSREMKYVEGQGCLAPRGTRCGPIETVTQCPSNKTGCPFIGIKCSSGLSCKAVGDNNYQCLD